MESCGGRKPKKSQNIPLQTTRKRTSKGKGKATAGPSSAGLAGLFQQSPPPATEVAVEYPTQSIPQHHPLFSTKTQCDKALEIVKGLNLVQQGYFGKKFQQQAASELAARRVLNSDPDFVQ